MDMKVGLDLGSSKVIYGTTSNKVFIWVENTISPIKLIGNRKIFFEMCLPRDQANPFAYKCILPLHTSYINGITGWGWGREAVKMLNTDDDANPTHYLFSFILVKPVTTVMCNMLKT